jgi:ferric-dicitrate binding protein FerR (iron transport regulator)
MSALLRWHPLASRSGRAYTGRMGWRAWDAYERDAKERQRALPWRERYNWRGLALIAMAVAVAALAWWAMP